MNAFFMNLVLALIWILLTGSWTPLNMVVGFCLGLLLLRLLPRFGSTPGGGRYANTVFRILAFLPYFARILVMANFQMAWTVLSPRMRISPRFVECELPGLTRGQAVVVATCITLTPGTLSVQLSRQGRSVLVHALFGQDPEQVRTQVRELCERLWGAPKHEPIS